jgi:hypothetical protein
MKNKAITIIIEEGSNVIKEEEYFNSNYFHFITDKISVNKKNANRFSQKRIILFFKDLTLPFLKIQELFSIKKTIQKKQAVSIFFLPRSYKIFHFLLEGT